MKTLFCLCAIIFPGYLFAQFADNLAHVAKVVPQVSGGLPIIHVLDVQPDGDKLYSSGYGGITLFDISNIDQPVQLSNYNPITGPTGGFYHRMVQRDGMVYAARRVGGLDILDFTDPRNPNLLLTYQMDDSTAYENVFLSGDTLFASCYKNGIEVINVADPAAPRHITFIPATNVLSVAKVGRYLFAADILDGLVVYDIRDIMNPRLIKNARPAERRNISLSTATRLSWRSEQQALIFTISLSPSNLLHWPIFRDSAFVPRQ